MSTDFTRVTLSCGAFDALCASDFAQRFPPHFHETFAVGVVESGGTRLWTRRGAFTARAGTILAFAPGEIHAAVPLGDRGYAYRMIYPGVDVMREIGLNVALFHAPVIDDSALGFSLAAVHRPLMDGGADARDESRFVAALRALIAKHGRAVAAASSEEKLVEDTRRYLETRFAEPVRLASVAELCGVTPFRLIKVFRRAVGVPPYKYLVQLRVNRAQAMLCAGASVADVAYACGFSDQSHLTRTFKRAVGVPPGRYVRSVTAALAG